MALVRLRNVKSGEIRDAETNSDEYTELINEVYDHDGSARPKWEITGQHHAQRIDADEIQEEDLGYEHKPLVAQETDISEVGPEQHPERAMSPAEAEMGLTWEQKAKELSLVDPRENRGQIEPLERTDPAEREERGRELAGSVGGKKSNGRSKRSGSKSSGSGGSTSESGSGSGSSSSSSSGSGSGSSSSGGSSS